jgi:hypothetical protein
VHRPLQSPLGLIIILATLVAACSSSVTPVADGAPDGAASSDCLAAFEAAAAVSDMQDTHEDLYPAFDDAPTWTSSRPRPMSGLTLSTVPALRPTSKSSATRTRRSVSRAYAAPSVADPPAAASQPFAPLPVLPRVTGDADRCSGCGSLKHGTM